MDRYDIAIIGTGPAGISAAITARVRNKNIILIGSDYYSVFDVIIMFIAFNYILARIVRYFSYYKNLKIFPCARKKN